MFPFTALPLFVVVLSGVVISYAWASDLVYKLAGEEPPAQQQRPGPPGGGGQQPGAAPAAPLEGLDALLSKAEGQVEDWRSIILQLPSKPDAQFTVAVRRDTLSCRARTRSNRRAALLLYRPATRRAARRLYHSRRQETLRQHGVAPSRMKTEGGFNSR